MQTSCGAHMLSFHDVQFAAAGPIDFTHSDLSEAHDGQNVQAVQHPLDGTCRRMLEKEQQMFRSSEPGMLEGLGRGKPWSCTPWTCW